MNSKLIALLLGAFFGFLANPARDELHFCMIVDASHWRPENLSPELARFANLMGRPNYQTVVDGRKEDASVCALGSVLLQP